MSFDLDNYVEVNVRIEKFWEQYPNGRISTEIVKWNNGVITMKAQVYKDIKDELPAATGHAYEKEGSSFINKTSALENCETSVVGRALGILGFEIKKAIASKEEVENAIEQQNEPEPLDADEEIQKLLDLAFTSDSTAKKFVESFKGDKQKMLKILQARIDKEVNK